jgi:hypothetical protein
MTTLDTADPKTYILAHDTRVKQLDRMSAASLRDAYRGSLAGSGSALVYGGPESRDEFINAICEVEFPHIASAREAYVQSIAEG